jgi:hypothetical protein
MYLCLVGPRTFVPLTWLCKKQSAVSHSSSEAEVIALDAAIRMEAIPAIMLWEEILSVFDPEYCHKPRVPRPLVSRGDPVLSGRVSWLAAQLAEVDWVPPSLPKSHGLSMLIVFEDNEAVIQMTIKGRSPNMRHVGRVHRVDLDWLFERIREDPSIHMRYVGTKEQIADIFTKGVFTSDQWARLCRLAQIGSPKSLYTSTYKTK